MIQLLKKLQRDVSGATALEYGLILGLIVVVMVVGLVALGQATSGQFNYISGQVSSAGQAAS